VTADRFDDVVLRQLINRCHIVSHWVKSRVVTSYLPSEQPPLRPEFEYIPAKLSFRRKRFAVFENPSTCPISPSVRSKAA
jgi:hypothetical protein